jgi:plastocyanin
MSRLLALLLAAAALTFAACGGDDEEGGGNAGGGNAATNSGEPASKNAGAADNLRVSVQDNEFVPETISVQKGETVTWIHEGSAPHNVVNTQEGQQPKSDVFQSGATYEYKATKAGTIDYVCTLHPGMDGKIVVK